MIIWVDLANHKITKLKKYREIIMNNPESKNVMVGDKALSASKKQSKQDAGILNFFPFSLFKSKPNVSILRLEGIIGKAGAMKSGLSISSTNKLIEKAFSNDKTKLVCLCINSPGGSPAQSEFIAKRIRHLSETKNIPVISFVEDVAASGGYWLACSGDKIYASKSSIIGSIGVISSGFGFKEAIDKLGIERRLYTQGKNKSVLDPFIDAKEEDITIIKNLQKNIHEHFIDYIKTRRGRFITQDDEIVFNGEFWTGQIALDYGLIDGISDVYTYVHDKFGDDVKFDYVAQKKSFIKQLIGASAVLSVFKLFSGKAISYDQGNDASSYDASYTEAALEDFTGKLATQLVDSVADKLENKIMENRFNIK